MRKVIWCIVWILLFATSCGVIESAEGEEEGRYVLALVDFYAGTRTLLLVSAVGDARACNLSARFPGLYTASWSPDGRRIAFVSEQSGNREIYSVDLETLAIVNLTQNPAADIAPSWSPDGQLIAFVSDRDYCPSDDMGLPDASCIFWHGELYVMKWDGTDVRRVTETESSECGALWFPDGRRLVYSVPCSLVDGHSEIYILDLASGLLTQLTDSRATSGYNMAPNPSPDGRYILFHSFQDNDLELYLMNADGSEQVRLTDMPGPELSASWSPDGNFIAWEHNQEVLVMDVKTRHIINTGTKALSACRPRWSPSGEKIAFVAHCGVNDSGPHDAVYVMNLDGSDKVNVTPRLGGQHRFGVLGWVPIEWMEVCSAHTD